MEQQPGARNDMARPRQPVLFLPHGGGPCFFMDWPDTWDHMAAYLRWVAATLPRRPDAIVVMSSHWETGVPTVTSGAHPPLIYDYSGFPPHTYQLRYPAPGSPRLAAQVCALLDGAGITSAQDPGRGFDHGVFIPFMLAFPQADIPIVELSLQRDLNAALEIRTGAALQPLRAQNVLIVGTGMTYHNLHHLMGQNPQSNAVSREFDTWLTHAVESPPDIRTEALTQWTHAPGARICHPRPEHLLPLMFAAGAAGADRGVRDYSDTVMGKALSGFRFG
ncbi:DODA-type extradiol aromatic ring-opening family dioxygenase [Komagataeibacter europaeus]|uniref:DODA-type extradiol aromatic ring-opening family dioxygenase n=1 Tax=Komagataeibacter europaeus TaxID=33995 RepID=UPI00030601DA|nr:class III extradiol ring-cleavage dioxygenase [Komagataeibacter europaeus]GBQ43659.1 aromatic ring-opening dioxygenase catalytic subunit LigB [Komagataeibacter europaeus LMG 18890]